MADLTDAYAKLGEALREIVGDRVEVGQTYRFGLMLRCVDKDTFDVAGMQLTPVEEVPSARVFQSVSNWIADIGE